MLTFTSVAAGIALSGFQCTSQTTHEDSLLHLRKENDALTLASSRLKEQVEMLSQQVEPVEYLR